MNTYESIIAALVTLVFLFLIWLCFTEIRKYKERKEIKALEELIGQFNLNFSRNAGEAVILATDREKLNLLCKDIISKHEKFKNSRKKIKDYDIFMENMILLRREMLYNGESYL